MGKSRISGSPKGARFLSSSSDIITTTTPGVFLADWRQALQKKPMAMSTALPHHRQIQSLRVCMGDGDEAAPGCVKTDTALGMIMLLRQILLK